MSVSSCLTVLISCAALNPGHAILAGGASPIGRLPCVAATPEWDCERAGMEILGCAAMVRKLLSCYTTVELCAVIRSNESKRYITVYNLNYTCCTWPFASTRHSITLTLSS